MAETNAVMWMFERKGLVVGQRTADSGQGATHGRDAPPSVGSHNEMAGRLEELELELIDFGAEDFSVDGAVISVTTGLAEWPKIRDFLKTNGFEILSSGLAYIPKQKVPVSDEGTAKKVVDFVEAIEEDEDVSSVHTNAELQG